MTDTHHHEPDRKPTVQMSNALARRIRRHIKGRSHRFYVSTPPGSEKACQQEVAALGLVLKTEAADRGGFAFQGRLGDCYALNLHLRSANRILMRAGGWTAPNEAALKQKAVLFPWELYLSPHLKLAIHVTTHRSRLYHKAMISERGRSAIDNRLAQHYGPSPASPSGAQQVYLRAVRDRFTVSIDSSGELLYKRGIKTHGGRAPLRETLAAVALMQSGYSGNEPLLDPMCGTGTFALEAGMIAKKMPAGWYRNFAFADWPSFQSGQWRHLRRQAQANIVRLERPRVFASDTDMAALDALQKTVARYHLEDAVRVAPYDFFKLQPTRLVATPGIVVLNPPYGRRLGQQDQARTRLHEVVQKLCADFRGWRLALLVPQTLPVESQRLVLKRRPFVHGGLKLWLYTGHVIQ